MAVLEGKLTGFRIVDDNLIAVMIYNECPPGAIHSYHIELFNSIGENFQKLQYPNEIFPLTDLLFVHDGDGYVIYYQIPDMSHVYERVALDCKFNVTHKQTINLKKCNFSTHSYFSKDMLYVCKCSEWMWTESGRRLSEAASFSCYNLLTGEHQQIFSLACFDDKLDSFDVPPIQLANGSWVFVMGEENKNARGTVLQTTPDGKGVVWAKKYRCQGQKESL